PKIVRVLNLWQKNNVFSPDVIQPLLDLANPNTQSSINNSNLTTITNETTNIHHHESSYLGQQQQPHTSSTTSSSSSSHQHHRLHNNNNNNKRFSNNPDLDSSPKTTDDGNDSQKSQILSNQDLNKASYGRMFSEASAAFDAIRQLANKCENQTPTSTNADQALASQLQQLASCLSQLQQDQSFNNIDGLRVGNFDNVDQEIDDLDDDDDISTPTEAEPPYPKPSKLSKKLITNEKTLDTFAGLMQIIHQQSINKTSGEEPISTSTGNNGDVQHHFHHYHEDGNSAQDTILQKFFKSSAVTSASAVAAQTQQQAASNSMLLPNHVDLQSSSSDLLNSYHCQNQGDHAESLTASSAQLNESQQPSTTNSSNTDFQQSSTTKHRSSFRSSRSPSNDRNHRHNKDRHRSSRYRRSSSRDDQDRRERRHSRERSRSSNHRRSRSRSSSRSIDQNIEREREERERQREKRRKGYPPCRKDRMTICSTTLWIGHLPKRTTSESELNDLFGEFGVIQSIDLIPSRGCAFVCMDRRQDAYKAFSKIKSQSKILNSTQVKITWAPGKGIKNKEYKDYWESDIGCSFIPHKILLEQQDIDLDQLEEGGMVDEDSIPEQLKELRRLKRQEKKEKEILVKQQQQITAATSTVAVNPLIPAYPVGYVAAPPPPPPPPPPPLMPLLTPPTSTSFQTNLHPPPISLNHSIPMPVPPPPPPPLPPPPTTALLRSSGSFPPNVPPPLGHPNLLPPTNPVHISGIPSGVRPPNFPGVNPWAPPRNFHPLSIPRPPGLLSNLNHVARPSLPVHLNQSTFRPPLCLNETYDHKPILEEMESEKSSNLQTNIEPQNLKTENDDDDNLHENENASIKNSNTNNEENGDGDYVNDSNDTADENISNHSFGSDNVNHNKISHQQNRNFHERNFNSQRFTSQDSSMTNDHFQQFSEGHRFPQPPPFPISGPIIEAPPMINNQRFPSPPPPHQLQIMSNNMDYPHNCPPLHNHQPPPIMAGALYSRFTPPPPPHYGNRYPPPGGPP
ncbi:RNA binding domain containing protein, partial [Euroglyphus maynei]